MESWPNGQNHRHKWSKWVSSAEWLSTPSTIGWGAPSHPGGAWSRETSWGGSGLCSRSSLYASLGEGFQARPTGGRSGEAEGSARKQGNLGVSAQTAASTIRPQIKQKKMDGDLCGNMSFVDNLLWTRLCSWIGEDDSPLTNQRR